VHAWAALRGPGVAFALSVFESSRLNQNARFSAGVCLLHLSAALLYIFYIHPIYAASI
jgi:hypothetical protein